MCLALRIYKYSRKSFLQCNNDGKLILNRQFNNKETILSLLIQQWFSLFCRTQNEAILECFCPGSVLSWTPLSSIVLTKTVLHVRVLQKKESPTGWNDINDLFKNCRDFRICNSHNIKPGLAELRRVFRWGVLLVEEFVWGIMGLSVHKVI